MKLNIKKYLVGAAAVTMLASMTSCNDWLREQEPGKTTLDDFFVNGMTAIQTVNGCYYPLAWEFNNSYYSEWYFGDIASDDALKGGQNLSDGPDAYDIDNFKTNVSNGICLQYYRAKYQGIARCNLALQQVPDVEPDEYMTEARRDCLMGEAYFLRGLYYFQLVRVFGGVPLVDFVIDSSDMWRQPRATEAEVYEHILADLTEAEKLLWNKGDYSDDDLGRATKGAAQAMLCKVYMAMNDYDNAYTWGKKWVDEQYKTGHYALNADYWTNFTLEGENGVESVFEVQYEEEPTSDYGEGNGFTRGTFTTILVRPRYGNNRGWGWDHPTRNLYDAFEAGDPRREWTVGVPPEVELDNAEVNYLGNPYYNIKYAYMADAYDGVPLDHDSRSPMNYKVMRASDALLYYAEAALESGKDIAGAKWALEQVRARARALAADPSTALPEFPNYMGYADNTESLRAAIRHERRVELGMEGHRWFDLVRWGIAYETMDKTVGTYGSSESEAVKAEMANFVKGKHEYFPIPLEEIQYNPMTQNPGY